MKSTLIVKNFGPIKDIDIELRNVNVLIGPPATGKSALAKIYTIFKAPRKFFPLIDEDGKFSVSSDEINSALAEYNIHSFLTDETEIVFRSELHDISLIKGVIDYTPKLHNTIRSLKNLVSNFESNIEEIGAIFLQLADKFIHFQMQSSRVLRKDGTGYFLKEYIGNLDEESAKKIIDIIKIAENELSTNTALYIPAERNFVNIIKKYSLNLIKNNVPIPKHILAFGAELEKAKLDELPLDFIQKGLVYKNIDGEDRIFTADDYTIPLIEASSGIQSAVPIYVPIYSMDHFVHNSFVIEEPELNLFPSVQYKLIQQLESSRREAYWEDYGTLHTYTTHSPYVLSALNNLLYAYKVRYQYIRQEEQKGSKSRPEIDAEIDEKIAEVVAAKIDPDTFTAYQISDGYAVSIFDRSSGLIDSNYIDAVSDQIDEDFQTLMDLTK